MLKITNLNKKFRKKTIFNDLSYEFKSGIYILMGENGSGKSTLFKMIAGLDDHYDGKIEKSNIFYLPEKLTLPKALKTYEFINHYSKINKSEYGFYHYAIKYKLENKIIKTLSKGMIQKVGIILSLIDHYDVILYDEPLEGLDDESIKTFFEDIKDISESIILISLHEIPKKIKLNYTLLNIKEGCICEVLDK